MKELINQMTIEEKSKIVTGGSGMGSYPIERLGIEAHEFADGPHGVRSETSDMFTYYPNMCCIGASWDVDMIKKMGEAMGDECIAGGISMLLAPGINIKRHITCGRNFEYVSEDPIVSGEMAAGFINGIQSKGVAACLKHFAVNNQENGRLTTSFEVDIRTLMEIYLKGFEIAIKKSRPKSVMCAYNKIFSVWCAENHFLLTEILREKWGYEGFVVSDWGAVSDICKSLTAGLDLEMPINENAERQIKEGLESGKLLMEDLDKAVERVLKFFVNKPIPKKTFDKESHHKLSQELAASGITLLKNVNKTLPITREKYKRIGVIGEFAVNPLIGGQGSAEVVVNKKYIDKPLEELRNILGTDVEIEFTEFYKKREFSSEMLWPKVMDLYKSFENCDLVIVFVGSMESEDTENFDRRTVQLNPNYEMIIEGLLQKGQKVVVVNQSGSAMIFGNWKNDVDAIVQMWLGGEGAGRAIAEVLTGVVNPSGKLTETFPNRMPTHLNYPGNGKYLSYDEKFEVGYRYYDKHLDEVDYSFGHGLSYTEFEYSNMKLDYDGKMITITADVKNIGDVSGGEVIQLYVSKKDGITPTPAKELKAFKKLFLNAKEIKNVEFKLDVNETANYNVILREWIIEPCDYIFLLASSAKDIRLSRTIYLEGNAPYSVGTECEKMIGM